MKRAAAVLLWLNICWFSLSQTSFAATKTPEEIWKSLEQLPAAEREKKLIEGAKKETEMVWYTNTGLENANRYIQAFKKLIRSLTRRFGAPRPARWSRESSPK